MFLLCSSSNNTLLFQHIFVPLVEEDSVSIISDESYESGSDSEVEDLRCPYCRKTHRKFPVSKSIWEFSEIELKREKVKGQYWLYGLFKKYFKGRNGTKEARHYNRYVTGDKIKAVIVTVPPEMRFQLSYLLTEKRIFRDILHRRMITRNDNYLEYVKSSKKKIFMRSSGSRGYTASIGSSVSGALSW